MPTETAESSEPRAETGAQAAAAPRHRLGVLRHRHFRSVWLGAFGSSIGAWMEAVGIQWVMTQETLRPEWTEAGYPNATIMLGYLAAAQLGPTFLLGFLGGWYADRVDRRVLLLVSQAVLMAVAGALTGLTFAGLATPAVLMVLSVINGVTLAFNMPAWQTLTPRLVPREELTRAITLNGLQFNLARVIGPALAGILMYATGAGVLFAINTLSFLGVMIAVRSTPPAPPPPRTPGATFLDQLREALAFVFLERGPRAVFIALVGFSVFAAPLIRMLPLFAADVYHVAPENGEIVFGILLAVMGLGAVAGGLAMRYIPEWYPRHHFVPAALLGGGVSVMLFGLAGTLPLGAALIFFCGIFWLWSFNSSFAALQLLVDDRMRGRVLAVVNMAVFGAMPLGSLLAGLVGEAAVQIVPTSHPREVAVQAGVALLAVPLVLLGLVMLIWRTPEIDGADGAAHAPRRPGLIRGLTAAGHRPARG